MARTSLLPTLALPRRLAASVAVIGALLAPALAQAQSARELAAAKQAFKEGDAAEAAGDYPTALARFTQALSVKDTAQLHLRVGAVQEKLGRLNDALASYQSGLEKAASLPAVAKVARDQLDALRPRIPTLTLVATKPPPGFAVTLDDASVLLSTLGAPQRLDPGTHRLHAMAPGYLPRDQTFTAAERSSPRIELDLQPVAGTAHPTPAAVAGAGGSKLPGALVLGGGVAALVAGAALLGVSYAKDSSIDTLCKGAARMFCPQSQKPTIDGDVATVNAMRFSSIGVLAVGAAGVAAGSVLLVKAGRPQTAAHVLVVPVVGAGVVGVTAAGAF